MTIGLIISPCEENKHTYRSLPVKKETEIEVMHLHVTEPWNVSKHWKLGRGKIGSSPRNLQIRHGPANILT